MKSYHTSKGIMIELTALLDVILIMLFWVMMGISEDSKAAVENAENKTAAVQQELDDVQNRLDSIRQETDKEISKIWQMAENIDKNAAANQEALYGYEQGMLVTLNIDYAADGMLYIYNFEQKLGSASLSSEDEISQELVSALEKAGLTPDDVVLCALVYNSNDSLYKDVKSVKAAVDSVRTVYNSFYCTYIDTSRKED